MNFHSYVRRCLRTYPQWRFNPPRLQSLRQVQRFGSDYGGYFIDSTLLPANPVIYSLGVGEDISFDLDLIRSYGCAIHAFDPTPKVRWWVESQKSPDNFRFQAIGIADYDGEADFYLPPRPDFISHSIIHARQYSESSIRVPVAKLSTIMAKRGHTRIDLLKMDVEGAEYVIIDDIVKQKLEVGQIAVEFHHRLSGVGASKTRKAIADLCEYGMRTCYICPRFEVFTLVREVGDRK